MATRLARRVTTTTEEFFEEGPEGLPDIEAIGAGRFATAVQSDPRAMRAFAHGLREGLSGDEALAVALVALAEDPPVPPPANEVEAAIVERMALVVTEALETVLEGRSGQVETIDLPKAYRRALKAIGDDTVFSDACEGVAALVASMILPELRSRVPEGAPDKLLGDDEG